MKFSIISPCYNASKYLSRFFDSLLEQSFTDFELIIVNDGSTDNSLEIINKYKQICPFSTKIINKNNEGPLMARMDGYKLAKGDYVLFADSDDAYYPNALEILSEAIKTYLEPDVIAFKNTRIYEKQIDDNNFTIEKIDKKSIWDYGGFGLWNKTFKNYHLNLDNLLTFKHLSINEDFLMSFELIKNATTIYKINKPLYIYYCNENSITSTHTTNPSRLIGMEAFYEILTNMQKFGFENQGFETFLYESCEKFKDRLLNISIMNIDKKNKIKTFKASKKTKWYKSYFKKIFSKKLFKSSMLTKKQRIFLKLYYIGFYNFILLFSKTH